MRVLLVFAHPDKEKSHNAIVLREVRSFLDSRRIQYSVIDLYAEGFDPVMPHEEWDERHLRPDVKKYQEMVRESERLIFIYPVWWYTYPAVLKGFFDRVFTSNFAYNFMKEPAWMNISKRLFKWFLSVRLFYPLIYFFLPVKQHLRGKKAMFLMVNPQPQIKKVLEIAQALPLETVFESVREADDYFDAMQRKALGQNGDDI